MIHFIHTWDGLGWYCTWILSITHNKVLLYMQRSNKLQTLPLDKFISVSVVQREIPVMLQALEILSCDFILVNKDNKIHYPGNKIKVSSLFIETWERFFFLCCRCLFGTAPRNLLSVWMTKDKVVSLQHGTEAQTETTHCSTTVWRWTGTRQIRKLHERSL